MQWNLFQVDAFTAQPFSGNPAAVYLLPEAREDRWLQQVASEMNLSETAFLQIRRDGFNLRWFTPAIEVALCGHATLASAHILWEEEYLQPDEEARFHTLSGLLIARRKGDWIELDFPARPILTSEVPAGLYEALGLTASDVRFAGKNQFDYLVEVLTEEDVRGLKPDFVRLAAIEARGVIVTAQARDGQAYDFVSRFFAPQAGINEDPVTGSAHCCLAPYWSARLGRDTLVGYQASARGGIVRVHCAGERVLLGGQAVTVSRGILTC